MSISLKTKKISTFGALWKHAIKFAQESRRLGLLSEDEYSNMVKTFGGDDAEV